MADTVGQVDIRGLDVDKTLKGFALTTYIFKNMVTNATMSGDVQRWYQETAEDLTAQSPITITTDPLAEFHNLEPSWTRNVSYPQKYGAESLMSREDMKNSDITLYARTLLRLTRAVSKAVDTAIYNVLTENQSPSNIGTAAATGTGWDDTTNGNPILDILKAKQNIAENNYDMNGIVVAMDPNNYTDLMNYLITNGNQIPAFASEKVQTGVVGTLLGCKLVVSNNVVADSVFVGIPNVAVTWYSFEKLQTGSEDILGQGTKIAVWENGVAVLTDPKAAYLITDTNT